MSGELRATRTPYACYLSKPCHPTPFQARCALFGELNERLEDIVAEIAAEAAKEASTATDGAVHDVWKSGGGRA